jgi:hypothetical protein
MRDKRLTMVVVVVGCFMLVDYGNLELFSHTNPADHDFFIPALKTLEM